MYFGGLLQKKSINSECGGDLKKETEERQEAHEIAKMEMCFKEEKSLFESCDVWPTIMSMLLPSITTRFELIIFSMIPHR